MQVAFPVSSPPLLESFEQLIDYTPLTVVPKTTVWDTILLMNKFQPPAPYVLIVENWQAVGLFSWEDVLQVVESEINLKDSNITEVMNTSLVKLKYSQLQDIKLILNILTQFQGVPIVIEDETKQLVGYISPASITTFLLKDYQLKNKAIAASNNGIAIFDVRLPSKPIVYGNPEFERLSGDSVSEVLGIKNSFIIDIKCAINKLFKLDDTCAKKFTPIIRNYCKNGDEYWYQLNLSPIFNRKKKLTHYLCIQTDITEHKLAEMSLLLTQEKLQHLLFSSTGVIYSLDFCDDYNITFISDNILEMVGYQADEIVCDANFWVSHIHLDDLPLFLAKLPQVFTQHKVVIEYRFLHKNGNYIWIYEQSKLVKDYSNNPLEIVGYRIEITERKLLEENFKQALEKEKELNQLKNNFISMTSHEFRTPLSTILSSSELLENYRDRWDEEKQMKHFNRIKTAINHMTNLLNDVLFFGQAEAEKLDCSPVEIDLVEYSQQLIEDVQINQKNNEVGQPDVNIIFNIRPINNQTKLIVNIDKKALGHILNNLLSNAIKYSQPGANVNFTIYNQKGEAIFEIEDRGIGIPSEELPCLFDSFHRCQNVGNIHGTGLGLSIVKKCLDMLQGKINVTSEVGVGTKFTVTIPLGKCCNIDALSINNK